MNKIFFSLIILTLAFLPALSQEKRNAGLPPEQQASLSWINNNGHELKPDSAPANEDLTFLLKELKDKRVVGLGEASHGTHEFYMQKGRMIRYLITNGGFRSLAFEFPQPIIVPINNYLNTGKGNLKDLMRDMALYSTEEIYQLFEWIRDYNISKASEDRVMLIGLDNENYWSDPLTRDKWMAENLISWQQANKTKSIVWTHNVHLVKDTTSNYQSMGYHLKQQFGNKFYAIGFDTYEGTVNVLNGDEFEPHTFQSGENSFSATLAQAKHHSFFLPFPDDSPIAEVTSFITNIYSNWQEFKPLPIKPGADFDALVFIRNTTASIRLKQ